MLDVVSSKNWEKTLRFVLMFYRQATDRLPRHYQQLADCRPTVSQQVAYISGKTCWPSVGQLSADRQPTVGRQTTNCRLTVGWLSADRFFWGALLHNYRLNDWLTEWMTKWQTGWLTDWVTDWLADWPTDWLTNWLSECLTACQMD